MPHPVVIGLCVVGLVVLFIIGRQLNTWLWDRLAQSVAAKDDAEVIEQLPGAQLSLLSALVTENQLTMYTVQQIVGEDEPIERVLRVLGKQGLVEQIHGMVCPTKRLRAALKVKRK